MDVDARHDRRYATTRDRQAKSDIWMIFEEMRTEMKETKLAIQTEVETAIEEKKEIESKLERICHNPNTLRAWRKIQMCLKSWGQQGRVNLKLKLYGALLYREDDTEEEKYNKISKIEIKLTEKYRRKRCIIYPDSTFLKFWAMFLVILLVYTIIMVPLSLSVIEYKNDMTWFVLDMVVNFFFLCDIFINMRTAISEERDGQCDIFCQYAKTWLIFDIIAIFPFDLLVDDGGYGLTILTKVPRFMRLVRVFKLLKVGSNIRKNKWYKKIQEVLNLSATMTKLVQFLITMLIIIHITGCVWLFLAKVNDFGPGTWVYELKYDTEDKTHLYMLSIYWAIATIATVGYGDIHPFGVTEKLFGILWMVIGVAFYSYTVSTLSTILLGSNAE